MSRYFKNLALYGTKLNKGDNLVGKMFPAIESES